MAKKESKPPRKHHYVSRFYLAGFTPSGDTEDLLYVHDLVLKKSRQDKPKNVAWLRDFYQFDFEGADKSEIENGFNEYVEAPATEVIQNIANTLELPSGDDLQALMNFIALTGVRVPIVRESFALQDAYYLKQELRELANRGSGPD